MLHVDNVKKRLDDFELNISFTVEKGDYFVLLGPSGVGKTVVLEMIAGLTSPDTGKITWDETDITRQKIQYRNMGLVYQDQALFPHMSVERNIAYGLSNDSSQDRVAQLAKSVGVNHLLHRYPGTLSGGESQRVALARALATEPRCLLLDEPLSALDAESRTDLQALLRSLHRKGHIVIHVTHEYKEAMALATRVGIIEQGKINQIGTPDDVFHNPKSAFVARFVGFHNCFQGRMVAAHDGDCAGLFNVNEDTSFNVSDGSMEGKGFLVFRSEDVIIGDTPMNDSNCFDGTVIDIAPARLGSELTVDIGIRVIALVPSDSMDLLDLKYGARVWINVKPDTLRFIQR